MEEAEEGLKKLLLIALILFGCASTIPRDRHAFIVYDNGWGSAVAIGKGLFLAAEHTIKHGGVVAYKGKQDSSFIVLVADGDVVLLRSHLGRGLPKLDFRNPVLGEPIYWSQTFVVYDDGTARGVQTLLLQSIVSLKEDDNFTLGQALWPGASGAGVYNSFGDLVGIVSEIVAFYTESGAIRFGIASMINESVRIRIKQEWKSGEELSPVGIQGGNPISGQP